MQWCVCELKRYDDWSSALVGMRGRSCDSGCAPGAHLKTPLHVPRKPRRHCDMDVYIAIFVLNFIDVSVLPKIRTGSAGSLRLCKRQFGLNRLDTDATHLSSCRYVHSSRPM